MSDNIITTLADGAREGPAGKTWLAGAIVLGGLVLMAAFVTALLTDPVEAAVIVFALVGPYVVGKALVAVDGWRTG